MIEEKELEIINPYGFVYVTTNLINGKRYIGRCCMQTTRKNSWKHYLGSGYLLEKAFKKYGKENFKRTIISFAYDNDELNKQESDLIKFFDATNNDNYYNISDKYYYNFWKHATDAEKEEMKLKMSQKSIWKNLSKPELEKRKNEYSERVKGEKNPFFNKKHSDNTKRKISQSNKGKTIGDKNASYWKGKTGKEHNRYGSTFSEESKKKMSESAKKRIQRIGCPNHTSIIIILNGEEYFFNTLQDSYEFCKKENIIPNTYKKKEPYPMLCFDSFIKKIRKGYDFQLFQYQIDG